MQAAFSVTHGIAAGQTGVIEALLDLRVYLLRSNQLPLDTLSRAKLDPAQEVMGDGHQKKHAQDFVRASYHQLPQAITSSMGIHAFGRRRTPLVDLLGLFRLHP